MINRNTDNPPHGVFHAEGCEYSATLYRSYIIWILSHVKDRSRCTRIDSFYSLGYCKNNAIQRGKVRIVDAFPHGVYIDG